MKEKAVDIKRAVVAKETEMDHHRSPDSQGFNAAALRIHKSTALLAQALANIPGELSTISTESSQLEFQPTNQTLSENMNQMREEFQQQITTLNHNIEQIQQQMQPTNQTLSENMNQMQQQIQQQMQQQTQQFQQHMDQMQQQTQQFQQQMTALPYSQLDPWETHHQLSPLLHQQTSAPVPNFPFDAVALTGLTWSEAKVLGTNLGIAVPDGRAPQDVKARFREELRTTIGLPPCPA